MITILCGDHFGCDSMWPPQGDQTMRSRSSFDHRSTHVIGFIFYIFFVLFSVNYFIQTQMAQIVH